MLSKDVETEFRGCGDTVRVHPLSFSEYDGHIGSDKSQEFGQYVFFGGGCPEMQNPGVSHFVGLAKDQVISCYGVYAKKDTPQFCMRPLLAVRDFHKKVVAREMMNKCFRAQKSPSERVSPENRMRHAFASLTTWVNEV